MRKINEIILHCTATPEGRDVSVKEIDRWHRQRGFNGIGYHYVIDLNGTVHKGRPIERMGAHCLGHNDESIGIAYVGGCDANGKPKDTRTPAQEQSLRMFCLALLLKYPGATIHGHNEYAAKACPCFDATQWAEEHVYPELRKAQKSLDQPIPKVG